MGPPKSIIDEACHARGAALMGVVNATPDSFSDGGRYLSARALEERVDALIADGADVIDIGGESTRPRSTPVATEEQIARIDHALRHAIATQKLLVSVDTSDARVAEHALCAGARVINDVSCLADANLARVVAEHRATLIIMHARGPMSAMSDYSSYPSDGYRDVVQDVFDEWSRARDRAVLAGIPAADVWFDPGLGYNKNAQHSFELLQRLGEFRRVEAPIVIGPSRKSFIASLDRSEVNRRLGGTIAACLAGVARGASLLRVHDVQEIRQALAVSRAIHGASSREERHA